MRKERIDEEEQQESQNDTDAERREQTPGAGHAWLRAAARQGVGHSSASVSAADAGKVTRHRRSIGSTS